MHLSGEEVAKIIRKQVENTSPDGAFYLGLMAAAELIEAELAKPPHEPVWNIESKKAGWN